jgi:DNA gyrase subunit B
MSQTKDIPQNKAYEASTIKILEGLSAVRKRPAMYIGSSGPQGLHHLVYEVVDNSIDEALGGHCKNIDVTIHIDNSITIADDGRGIPVAAHPERKGKSTVEVVMTVLHAGGKFENDAYKFSGGLHGVGVSVVNALSEWLEVEVKREGAIWKQRYERGVPKTALDKIATAKNTGTSVRFKADEKIFETVEVNYDILANRLRELAFLNKGIKITITDERGEGKSHQFRYAGGIVEFVKSLNEGKNVVNDTPIYFQRSKTVMKATMDGGEKPEDIEVEICMQWNDTYVENVYSFVNNINTTEGGTHMIGFRKSLTRTINDYARKNELMKKLKENLSGDDLKEGITAVISLKISDPQFESQTKIKLGNTEVTGIVEQIVNEGLGEFLEENPRIARKVVDKAVLGAMARIEARKAREIVRKGALEVSSLPGKLADCSDKEPENCEIYIVEGDSAGGSAKQGRDRHFQAILPLRGKILNVERARIDRVLSNEEIRSLITALGTGIGETFNKDNLRYYKCIIMTDADVDGAHIRTLLLTFFFRQMKDLIKEGRIFIAQPPLYKVKKGKVEQYLEKDEDKDRLLIDWGTEDAMLVLRNGNGHGKPSPAKEGLRKGDLKQVLEAIQQLEQLDKLLQRKGSSMQRYLSERNLDPKRRFPLGLFTQGETLKLVFEEKEFLELESEVLEEEEEVVVPSASTAPAKSTQQELNLKADEDVAQDFEEKKKKYSCLDLRSEAGEIRKLVERIERFGLDATVFQVEAADQYKMTNDTAPFEIHADTQRLYAHSLRAVLNCVKDVGKKGISIQRYKGLGEMNAQQLWETTMNPSTRRLIRVTLEMESSLADNLFSTLMGDDVEKRRQFIQRHAPEVRNLDV